MTKKITIWTRAYRPFIMGGNVNAPIRIEAEGTAVNLGRGFNGFSVPTPAGGEVIVDAASGGIVGTSLEQVRSDVAQGDLRIMRKQIADAVEDAKKAEPVEASEFWTMFNRSTRR